MVCINIRFPVIVLTVCLSILQESVLFVEKVVVLILQIKLVTCVALNMPLVSKTWSIAHSKLIVLCVFPYLTNW